MDLPATYYEPALDTYVVQRHRDCADLLAGLRTPDPAWLDSRTPGWRDHPAAVFLYHSLLRRNPPGHAVLRRRLRRRLPAAAEIAPAVDRVLDDLAAYGASADFHEVVAARLPLAVIGDVVGVPPADHSWLATILDDLVIVLDPLLGVAARHRADRAADQLKEYFREHDPSGTEEERDGLMLLLAAGVETTAGLIGNAVDAALRAENRSYTAAALVAETLRWDAPVQMTERVAGPECRVGGITVPEGAGITLMLGAANRDPRRFADPDRFDPGRLGGGVLSFGAGRHYCLGASLSRETATTLLGSFLARFPSARPAGDPVRRASLTLRGFSSLPLIL
jgi:cytochrome P450